MIGTLVRNASPLRQKQESREGRRQSDLSPQWQDGAAGAGQSGGHALDGPQHRRLRNPWNQRTQIHQQGRLAWMHPHGYDGIVTASNYFRKALLIDQAKLEGYPGIQFLRVVMEIKSP